MFLPLHNFLVYKKLQTKKGMAYAIPALLNKQLNQKLR